MNEMNKVMNEKNGNGAAIQNKYDFTVLFDVTNGNPNGDPDADNMPRIDNETGLGLVTDVAIKRKIRNYVSLLKPGEDGYQMYITSGQFLNDADLYALKKHHVLDDLGIKEDIKAKELKDEISNAVGDLKKEEKKDMIQRVREAACSTYFDVRTFGAVMTGYSKIGTSQIKGPVQIGIARSIDPITCQDITITRCARNSESEKNTAEENNNGEKKGKEIDNNKDGSGTMGRKYIVPYGLYRVEGHISAAEAEKCSFSEADLELLWKAIANMFEEDHSSSRGEMVVRELFIFKHKEKLGSVKTHKLQGLIHVNRKEGVKYPRNYSDYEVTVDEAPEGVTFINYMASTTHD